MREVYLHGRLANEFGDKPLEFSVASVTEATQALIALLPGFDRELRKGSYQILCKNGDSEFDLDESQISMQLGRTREIHFIPVIEGAKGSSNASAVKIVLGVALVAGALFFSGGLAGLGAIALGVNGFGLTYGSIAMVGVSMAAAGVSALLAPTPKTPKESEVTSNIFNNTDNVANQGIPVPCVIGRFRVGSVVMSMGVAVDQIGTDGQYYDGIEYF